MLDKGLLSLLIWLPVLAAILILFVGQSRPCIARAISVMTAIICLLISLPLYLLFDASQGSIQLVEYLNWIPMAGMHYALGVDGLSLPMIILTNFTGLIVILAAVTAIKEKVAQYMASFLIMQGMMVGVFAATDAMLFYFFWEGMLIPMYICLGVWGSQNRSFAAIKFFIYTFLGSAMMLIALLYLRGRAQNFDIASFYLIHLSLPVQTWLFVAFFLAFAVKVPMWPFHTWLPDVHEAAPSGGSVILAALMLKMGIYGFIRFNLPITPDASQLLAWVMIILGLIAVIYVAYIAIIQTDMKRLIAYSSISHMGFAMVGCFMVYVIFAAHHDMASANLSLEGAVVQMISHAFGSGAMFIGAGVLFDQLHTRLMRNYGGVAVRMPVFAAFFMLFAMSNVGLPGTSGFVGEFMILLAAFHASFWVAFFAASTLILGAAYTLWMVKQVFFGPIVFRPVEGLQDISGWYKATFILLALGVLYLGIYPQGLLHMMQASVSHLLQISLQSRM